MLSVVFLCSFLGSPLIARAQSVDPNASATSGTATEKPESQMTEEEKKAKEEREAYEKELKACYDLPVESNSWENWPKGPGFPNCRIW